jgi:hypothetical protein
MGSLGWDGLSMAMEILSGAIQNDIAAQPQMAQMNRQQPRSCD